MSADKGWPPIKVWLDDEHARGYSVVSMDGVNEFVGINEWHRAAGDIWCGGWAAFPAYGLEPNWDYVGNPETGEGFTMSPSIQCTRCGNHGYIRDGKWVPA